MGGGPLPGRRRRVQGVFGVGAVAVTWRGEVTGSWGFEGGSRTGGVVLVSALSRSRECGWR